MNGLATLLAPTGGMPQVLGMASQSPGSGQTQTDSEGFLGILQQMIGGSMQMAALLSMLPVQAVQGSATAGGSPAEVLTTAGNPVTLGAEVTAKAEQPSALSVLSESPAGHSPPQQLETVSLYPALAEDQPVVVQEHTRSPGQVVQVTTPQQSAATTPAPGQGGTIPLPLEVLAEQADTPAPTVSLTGPAVPALPVEQETPVIVQENAKSLSTDTLAQLHSRQTVGRATSKLVQPGRVPSTLLRTEETAVVRKSSGKSNREEHQTTTTDTPTTEESPAVEVRPVRVSETGDQSAPAKIAAGEGLQNSQPAKSEPVKTAAVISDDTAVSVKGEEIPAKAVVAGKPVAEMQLRDDGTAKNALTHLQTQISTVKPASTRLESVTQHLSEYLTPLPPETARSVVDQIVTGAALQVRGDTSEMRIKLVPDSLGEVTLNVRMEGGQMQAQIDVSHAAVKAALESSMPQLREALSSHGIEVQRLDVFHNGQSMTQDTGGEQANRSPRHSTKRQSYVTDAIDQLDTGRMMGYNTIEVVM